MRTLFNSVLMAFVVLLGLWAGSTFMGAKQKVYQAPSNYTEKIDGLDGLKVQ